MPKSRIALWIALFLVFYGIPVFEASVYIPSMIVESPLR
jgi:hypothetical protein